MYAVYVELSDLVAYYRGFQPSLFMLENNETQSTFKNNAQSATAPNSFDPCMNEATTSSEMNLCNHCIVQRHHKFNSIFIKYFTICDPWILREIKPSSGNQDTTKIRDFIEVYFIFKR